MRKQNRFDETEKVFCFGSHVEGQDATAAKKTVSGLLKILQPGGEWTKDEVAEYVELALEGRRQVKEQLKKRGSFEFYKTSFSYIDQESGIERTVGLPKQGGPGVISQDPLLPGTIYTAAANEEAKVGLFRLEVTIRGLAGRGGGKAGYRVLWRHRPGAAQERRNIATSVFDRRSECLAHLV